MPHSARPIVRYDPVREAAERWSDWVIEEKKMKDRSERFLPDEQIVIVDINQFGGDRAWAWAHVLVHLENGDYDTDARWITDEQEDLADWIVMLRLDREQDREWLRP